MKFLNSILKKKLLKDIKSKSENTKKFSDYSTAGLMFPASTCVGFAVGYFFDYLFNTKPVFIIIFTIYGIAAAFYNLFRISGK